MALVTWPAYTPNACIYQLKPATRDPRSPFTGARDAVQLAGSRWIARYDFYNRDGYDWREIQGFLAAMRGRVNTAYIKDFTAASKRGYATGSMTVTGAADAQTVTIGNIGGPSPSFRRGDKFTANHRMYQILAEVTHSGGSLTVEISPPLRTALSGASIITTDVYTTMQLATDDEGQMMATPGVDAPWVESFSINFVEAL